MPLPKGYTLEAETAAPPPAMKLPKGYTLEAAPAAAPVQQEYGLADGAIDVLKGFGKSVMSTVVHGGDAIRRATGMDRVIDHPDVQAVTTPTNTAQRIGSGIEQAVEYVIPAGAVTRAAKGVQALTAGVRGAKALNIGARAGLEAASAAGVAAVQTGGDTGAMRDAALTGGALSAGAGVVAAGLKPLANALRKSAVAQYGRALNPTKEATKFLAKEDVVPGLIERGVVSRTVEGLQQKAAQRVAQLGKQIGDEWASLPAGTKVEADAIFARLEDAIAPHTVMTSAGKRIAKDDVARTAISNLEGLQSTLLDVAETNPATGKLEVPVDKLRDLRQYWDNYAARAGRYHGKTLAEASKAEGQGLAADAIRAELGKDFPSIAAINKEFSFWKNASKVAEETAQRQVGQSKGLVRRVAGVAGAATGFGIAGVEGAVIGKVALDQLEKLVSSTAWNTVSAVTKDRLAKALASGNRGAAEFYIGKAAKGLVTSAAANRTSETPPPELAPVQ